MRPSCERCIHLGISCRYDHNPTTATPLSKTLVRDLNLKGPRQTEILFHLLQIYELGLASELPTLDREQKEIPSLVQRQDVQNTPQVLHPDLDRSITMKVVAIINATEKSLEKVAETYFATTHTWLTTLYKKRFYERLEGFRSNHDAEFAMLLLSMHILGKCWSNQSAEVDDTARSIYITAKCMFSTLQSLRRPSLDMVQSGLLIAIYEMQDNALESAYLTIWSCTVMGYDLGLHQNAHPGLCEAPLQSWALEEKRRIWWGVLIADRILRLQDSEHMRPLVVENPNLDFYLPSMDDSVWNSMTDDWSPSHCCFPISTPFSQWAGSFCRLAQVSYLLGTILDLKFQKPSLDLLMERVSDFDQSLQALLTIIQENATQAGSFTKYCGSIALSLSALFLLHQYQLESTINVASEACQQAASLSQVAITGLIAMWVDILRVFPSDHFIQLSPPCLYGSYQAAYLHIRLGQMKGCPITTSFDDTLDVLRDFMSKLLQVWKNAGE
ncbi:MAG: hypothetical protein M1834_008578 [Cirrosporium novae-zelandiae]|nr:MAG: hypothetical protein M1834_008578 [Cirrosporium novae-zelandiae]